MRKSIPAATLAVMFVCGGFASNSAFAAAAAAGDGDPVKGWYGKAFDSMKDATKPIVVYIYDAKVKTNHTAQLMEGKTFLDNSDVAAKLKSFYCVKLKADTSGSQEKTWPANYISSATGNATLLIMSSDMRSTYQFDKSTPKDMITADNLIKTLEKFLDSEPKDLEKKKKEKEEKEKQLAAANTKKEDDKKNGGLNNIAGIEQKDDTKKDPKKDDPKKPADQPSKPKPLDE
jgi:hypothetical protein